MTDEELVKSLRRDGLKEQLDRLHAGKLEWAQNHIDTLTLQQRFRLCEIAHETGDPEVRKASLELLHAHDAVVRGLLP